MQIPEDLYRGMIGIIPIFCIDILVSCRNNFLLLKRLEHPMKGVYWVVGGRAFL